MADDKSKPGEPDGYINMNEGYEIRYWTKKLGISRDRLEELVRQYGYSAETIRQTLKAA
jgi:hypothetical protein